MWPQNVLVLILSVNLWKSHLTFRLFFLSPFVFARQHGNEGEVKIDSTFDDSLQGRQPKFMRGDFYMNN